PFGRCVEQCSDTFARRQPPLGVLALHGRVTTTGGHSIPVTREERGGLCPCRAGRVERLFPALGEVYGGREASPAARSAARVGQLELMARTTSRPPPAFSMVCSVPPGTVASRPLPSREVSPPAATIASPSRTW